MVVPVPSEVFSVLDKLGEPNWRHEIRELEVPNTSDRTKLALLFGHVVAEGFVAVQAEDKEAVKDAGKDVISIATALGLTKAVRPHAQAILDAADKNDWKSIRKEFDQTQKTVKDTMEEMKDIDLSQCVSLGGWLRGLQARAHPNTVVVALASKLARIAWKLMLTGESYAGEFKGGAREAAVKRRSILTPDRRPILTPMDGCWGRPGSP